MSVALFGRAWDIQVLAPSNQAKQQTLLRISSNDAETQSLRCTFDVSQDGYAALWQAELDIYNPNLSTVQTITEGCEVSIAAGYQSEGAPSEIFRGRVYQAIWMKEDATTVILRLLCFVMLDEIMRQFVSADYPAVTSQRQILLDIAKRATTPIPIAYLPPDSDFKIPPLPRSQTVFGKPQTIFAQIAKDNDFALYYGANGVYMGPIKADNPDPNVIYAPPIPSGSTEVPQPNVRYCLIGTPQQTPQGVSFRVLLDSRLNVRNPPMKAQLVGTVITANPFQIATNDQGAPLVQAQTILDARGIYYVADVRFLGDTRGNVWETQVIGAVSLPDQQALLGGNQ